MSNSEQQAITILKDNDFTGYTIPTKGLYPYQWNWDSVFCALGWFNFDTDRALQEIEHLLNGQWENGMIPHILFHKYDQSYFPGPDYWQCGAKIPSSGYTQPPVLAWALNKLWNRTKDTDVQAKIAEFFPDVMRWHQWFWRDRNPTGKGLIAILHPWESGRDNLPDWDQGMKNVDYSKVKEFRRKDTQHVNSEMRPHEDDYKRYLALVEIGKQSDWNSQTMMERQPFLMLDVLMTSIWIKANEGLLEIAKKLNKDKEAQEIAGWLETSRLHFSVLWNPNKQAFCTYDLKNEVHVDHVNSATFLPLGSGALDEQKTERLCNLFDEWIDQVGYGLPSFDPRDALFEEKRYWRGPVWLIINYLIRESFLDCGKTEQAEILLRHSNNLIKKSGFWEYYSPLTGNGLGGSSFSWSAAVWLDWFKNNPETSVNLTCN